VRQRSATLALGGLVLAALALPGAVLGAAERAYTANASRAVYAAFEDRNGDRRTLTTVLATRGKLNEVDGSTFGDQSVFVWTTTWNAQKDKVRRVAFGVADRDEVEVNVPNDFDSARVFGKVRVRDVVKDQNYTLDLDLSWERDGARESVSVDQIYSPPEDNRYREIVAIESVGNQGREAFADGEISRGAVNLVGQRSNEAWFFQVEDVGIRIVYPE
jgi:hypothetical protein